MVKLIEGDMRKLNVKFECFNFDLGEYPDTVKKGEIKNGKFYHDNTFTFLRNIWITKWTAEKQLIVDEWKRKDSEWSEWMNQNIAALGLEMGD